MDYMAILYDHRQGLAVCQVESNFIMRVPLSLKILGNDEIRAIREGKISPNAGGLQHLHEEAEPSHPSF